MSMMLSLGLLCMAAAPVPVPVILDTDLGDDIDDTWALCQALGTPEIDLKLVVTAFHNTPLKARLVAKILESVGRTDIPLGIGKKTEEKGVNQAQWLGEYTLDQYKGRVIEDGVGALVDAVNASKGQVTICAIGPVTNLAEALRRDPGIAKKARVVLMAGSVRKGYEGKATPQPEWNVLCDVAAARAVFAAPWDITIAPLDSCGTLRLTGADYEQVAGNTTAKARTIIGNYDQWVNRRHYAKDSSSILFDTVAVHLIHSTNYLAMETVPLRIADDGLTAEDKEKGRPVHCAMGWTDEAGFKKALIAAVTKP